MMTPGFLLIRNDEFMKIMKCPLFEFLKFRIPGFLIIKNDEFLKMMKNEDEEFPDIHFAGGIS